MFSLIILALFITFILLLVFDRRINYNIIYLAFLFIFVSIVLIQYNIILALLQLFILVGGISTYTYLAINEEEKADKPNLIYIIILLILSVPIIFLTNLYVPINAFNLYLLNSYSYLYLILFVFLLVVFIVIIGFKELIKVKP